MEKGKLFVVATPIGNLEDITLRAIRVLNEVDVILSEDTRETAKVLQKYEISNSQVSYRDQNHVQLFPKIKEMLDAGQNIAITSDSGTPLISDPGFKLVSDLRSLGYEIVAVPGPSSVISALSVSGLPTDKFTFVGFLPKKKGPAAALINKFGTSDSTLIIFESPFRVIKLLEMLNEILGNRFICIVKDQTKLFEQIISGHAQDLLMNSSNIKNKGEYIVLVAKEGFKP